MTPAPHPYTLGRWAIDTIARWEGYRAQWYRDVVGVWTIGYGHARKPGDEIRIRAPLGAAAAVDLLRMDAGPCVRAVDELVHVPLEQCQIDALVSWLFNVGSGALGRSSLLVHLNAGQYDSIPTDLEAWCKVTMNGVRVTNAGLLARRRSEGSLWRGVSTSPREIPEPVHRVELPDAEILRWGEAFAAEWTRDLPDLGLTERPAPF